MPLARTGERRARRVVIAGGGFAALEALVALRTLVGQRLAIELIAPSAEFIHRPLSVAAWFGAGRPRALEIPWLAHAVGATFVADAVVRVDPDAHTTELASGRRRTYDTLLLAPGARAQETRSGAVTFGTPGGTAAFANVLDDAQEGRIASLAFLVPSGPGWPLAVYELALLTADRLQAAGSSVEITLISSEPAPLAAFGRAASDAVSGDLKARGIRFVGAADPDEVIRTLTERADGEASAGAGARALDADAVVTLPRLLGPGVAGLPSDELGFLPVDPHGRVRGVSDVYAAGDAIDFPIKHGGLATLQADAAAEAIAASLGAPVVPAPFRPVLRGVLLTGGPPRYLEGFLGGEGGSSSNEPLWWPPAKVAGRYLAPFVSDQVPRGPASPGVDVNVEIDEWTRLARTEG